MFVHHAWRSWTGPSDKRSDQLHSPDRSQAIHGYECPCGDKWNQTRPDRLSEGQNLEITVSLRATKPEDERRSAGYSCSKCFLKKNKAIAIQQGVAWCVCAKKKPSNTSCEDVQETDDMSFQPLKSTMTVNTIDGAAVDAAKKALEESTACLRTAMTGGGGSTLYPMKGSTFSR
jgi:hypothetical protein